MVNISDLGIPYPQLVIETTDRFNRENPQTVKSFLKGFIEGVHFVATHKDETKKIMTKYLKTSIPRFSTHLSKFLQITDYSGKPNMEGMRNAIDEVAQRMPAARSKSPKISSTRAFLRSSKGRFLQTASNKS